MKKCKKVPVRSHNEEFLIEMIALYEEHNKTYGYLRITEEYNEFHGTKKHFY